MVQIMEGLKKTEFRWDKNRKEMVPKKGVLRGSCPGCGGFGTIVEDKAGVCCCVACGQIYSSSVALGISRRERKRRLGNEQDLFKKA
jgi:hypothetical protein